MNRLTTYLKEAIRELKKVVWPTQKQTTRYAIIVVIISLGTAVFFGALDFFFSWLLGIII